MPRPGRISNLKRKTREENDKAEGANQVKRPRNKKAFLSELLEMPTDIVFEIFGLLEPLDLLNIARTTKALRSILMSSSSMFVWKSARSSIVGLPDCPDDLSEPQYAALMFATECSFCQKTQNKDVVHISWYGRFRCCDKCVKLKLVNLTEEPSYWDEYRKGYPRILANWVPCLVSRPLKRSFYHRPSENVYVLEDVERQWKEEYCAIEDPKAQYCWLLEKLESCYATQKHARACALWYKALQNGTDADQMREVFRRDVGIMDYIQKDINWDWEEELYKLPPNIPHPLDMQPFQDLWNPLGSDLELSSTSSIKYSNLRVYTLMHNVGPKLCELQDTLSATLDRSYHDRYSYEFHEYFKFRKRILSGIYDVFIKTRPINSPLPSFSQFYWLAKDHDLIDYSKPDAEALRIPFDEVVALWRKYVDDKLIGLISSKCGRKYVSKRPNVLDLATTLFVCHHCDRYKPPMRRDHATVHRCTDVDDNFTNAQDQNQFNWVFGPALWRHVGAYFVYFKKGYTKVMRDVVKMCGLDPKVTTARQMDELDPVFECRACNSVKKGRATFSWASLLRHQRVAHAPNPKIHSFRLLDEPEASKAREGIKEEHARSTRQVLEGELRCPYHCGPWPKKFNLNDYRKHMKEEHKMLRYDTAMNQIYLDYHYIIVN